MKVGFSVGIEITGGVGRPVGTETGGGGLKDGRPVGIEIGGREKVG